MSTAAATGRTRVGIYVRMSSDRQGDELGVQRQLSSCRSLMKAKGWGREVDVYTDNDVSASGRVERPEYRRLLDDVESGRIDCIVVWSFDRLTRSMLELEEIIALHERHGMNLATVDGDLNLSSEVGRMVVRILAAVARAELEVRRKRQLNERTQKAESGAVHGGGIRPFGYCEDRVTIDETEAVYVREAAARVLAGESLRGVWADFAKRGVRSPTGGTMTHSRLRVILVSARISGRRSHWQGRPGERRPVLQPIVGEACWPGIISAADGDRLRDLLTARSRTTHVSPARRHLLPGFLSCAVCGRRMVSGSTGTSPRYQCELVPGSSCRKVVTARHIDELVVADLLAMIDTPKYRKLLNKKHGIDQRLVKSLADDEAELLDLAAQRAHRELEFDEYRVQRDIVKERRDESKALIDAAVRDDALRALLHGDQAIEDAWKGLTLSQQRGVIDGAIERIVVSPPTRRGNVFDRDRVEIVWRG